MLAEMARRGIPVVIGADAHDPGRVADGFVDALDMLRETGYSEVSLFLNRRRQDLPIDPGAGESEGGRADRGR